MKRLKGVLKRKGVSKEHLAECIGITRQSLIKRVNDPKMSTVIEVAKCLDVEPIELIETTEAYQHLYNSDGDWYGVLKK